MDQNCQRPPEPKAVQCTGCGDEFAVIGDPRRLYCTPECRRANRRRRSKKVRVCETCGASVTDQARFCSMKCLWEPRYLAYIERWLAGDEAGGSPTNGEVSHFVRRWLNELQGSCCWRRGWAEKHPADDRVPVQIDHVDGDATNNRPENLRLLCPNCHSLTPTFGRRNRNGQREWRRRLRATEKAQ